MFTPDPPPEEPGEVEEEPATEEEPGEGEAA
jgi:hypothetical protein